MNKETIAETIARWRLAEHEQLTGDLRYFAVMIGTTPLEEKTALQCDDLLGAIAEVRICVEHTTVVLPVNYAEQFLTDLTSFESEVEAQREASLAYAEETRGW